MSKSRLSLAASMPRTISGLVAAVTLCLLSTQVEQASALPNVTAADMQKLLLIMGAVLGGVPAIVCVCVCICVCCRARSSAHNTTLVQQQAAMSMKTGRAGAGYGVGVEVGGAGMGMASYGTQPGYGYDQPGLGVSTGGAGYGNTGYM